MTTRHRRAPSVLPEVPVRSPNVTSRRTMLETRFVSVESVHAEFGEFAKQYDVVDFGPRAGVVAVRGGRVLLTAQYRFLLDGVSWEIPGGRVDPGESAEQAARRECLEETGVLCADLRPLVTYRPGLDNVENLTSVFSSEHVEIRHPFTPQPSEVLALAWVPLDRCVSEILNHQIVDALTVCAVLAYRALTHRRAVPLRRAKPTRR
jgi:ADP-ribose pyrophosphatase